MSCGETSAPSGDKFGFPILDIKTQKKVKKSGYLGDWKSSLCNINLSLKLGGKVRIFSNFFLSKINF